MANKNNKTEGNVPGAYYVDAECIACGVCESEAPDNFKMSDDDGSTYVYKQPENDDEKKQCESALESCPVEAIGNDG